ncbi:hypothetical protein ANMWB30_24440 [Arthrobacter sp. MWB30]|nr:hypothetical protein ANMWB30_24440 [Arthrobacter sp. MWB30]
MMPRRQNSVRRWLSSGGTIAGALMLYVATAVGTMALTGSSVLGAVVSNAVAILLGQWWRRREGNSGPAGQGRTGTSSTWPASFMLLAGACLIFCWFVGQATSIWFYELFGSPGFDQHNAAKAQAPAALMITVALILAPMGEEMLMRGIAYTTLRHHMPVIAASMITACLFSAMHLNIVQIAATFPLGMLLAIVYEFTGKLRVVVLMHTIFNVMSMTVPVQLVAALSTPPLVLASGAVVVVTLAGLYRAGLTIDADPPAGKVRSPMDHTDR